MKELVEFIVYELTGNHNSTVELVDNNRNTDIIISADKDDIGKIIGKQGRISKAIRTIVRAASQREHKKYFVKIVEK